MKKLNSFLLILCLILSLISPTVLATDGSSVILSPDGYVDEDGVVTISNSEGLLLFANLVNNGEDFSEKVVTLANDIDLQNISWTPIGTPSYKYSGTFDGAGHRISNISVDSTVQGVGLFGVVSNATIKNLVVSGEIKTTAKYAGGIVGQSSGSCTVIIENCGNEANVTAGGANAAGIIGCNDSSAADITIKNCYNVGTIKGSIESAAISGWIGNSSGSNASEVINCYNIGSIEGVSAGNSFVRYSGSTSPLTNCYQLDTIVKQANVDSISEESVLSGELSIKLGEPFGQTIGTSDYPVIDGLEVLVAYGDTCIPVYVNDLGDLSTDRPPHSDSFEEFYIGVCEICGELNSETAVVNGFDFTTVSEDITGHNWNWYNDTKTLQLNGAAFVSSCDFVIKLPDGAVIQLTEGSETIIEAKGELTKGIIASGDLLIEGNGKLVVSTVGAEAIYGSNEGSTVDITIKDCVIETNNSIILPDTNKNSSLTITNSKVTTNRGLLNVSSGDGSEYTKLIIEESELVVGKVNVSNIVNSGVTTVEATNSSVDAQQTSGSVADAATAFKGKDIVVKIENTYWRAYTQGYGYSWYHSYAFRIDAGNSSADDGSIDMSIQDSYLLLYGMNRGLNINSNGSISEDSSINNSVIISFAKGEDSNFSINYVDEDGASASAVDEIVENNIVFIYSNMQTSSAEPETTTTVYGSPVITESFVLPDSLGACADLPAVTQDIVLTEGQSITVAEGDVFDVGDVTIMLNNGSSISGNIIGNIVISEEAKMVIYKNGTNLSNASLVESIAPVGYTVPEPIVEETSCDTLIGWFTDEECTAQFDFSTVVSESLTLYSKWEETHTWGEGVVTLEPTYTSTGIKTYTCTECDDGEKTEILPKKVRSSGGSSSPTYSVTVEKSDDGDVKVSSARVRANATVTITVTPNNGKVIDEIRVIDTKGNEIELIEKEENIYTYKQPKLSVTVKVIFKCSGEVGCPSYEYVDINTNKWYHEALDFVVEKGIMYGDEFFYPDADLTRAELTEILWLLENKPTKISEKRFIDVEADNKYYNSIYWARENNIVNGYSEEYFRPKDSITREQMTAILYRYSGYKKYGNVIDVDFNLEFNDVTDISTWAIDSIIWAVSNEVIMGYDSNELKPLGNITRAEMAQMIKNYLEVYVKEN